MSDLSNHFNFFFFLYLYRDFWARILPGNISVLSAFFAVCWMFSCFLQSFIHSWFCYLFVSRFYNHLLSVCWHICLCDESWLLLNTFTVTFLNLQPQNDSSHSHIQLQYVHDSLKEINSLCWSHRLERKELIPTRDYKKKKM